MLQSGDHTSSQRSSSGCTSVHLVIGFFNTSGDYFNRCCIQQRAARVGAEDSARQRTVGTPREPGLMPA
jgi:hypothetical protein